MITTDDICMIVFTSALNLHERALSVQNTWLQDFPCGYLIGGYYIDPKLRMISAGNDIGEDYFSAADKQYYGLKKAYELHPDKKWYYITGCDAFVYSDNLCSLLSKYNSDEYHMVGGLYKVLRLLGEDVNSYLGGPGFALSNALAKKTIDNIPDIYSLKEKLTKDEWGACDLVLSYYVQNVLKIVPDLCKGFYNDPPYESEYCPVPLAYHRLNIREIYTLYSGKPIKQPGRFFWFVDKSHRAYIKLFKTKRFVNFLCKLFYGRKSKYQPY